jgi:uncharacterized membrane protein YccC
MGALVYTLIAVFLWPRSSIGALNETHRKLWATQATVYRTYRGLMCGQGQAGDSRPLRLQEVELLNQFEKLLNAAEMDSYEVWEVRRLWRRFRDQSKALMETLERWRQSFAEIQSLPLAKLLPNLEAVCSELERRFAQVEGMLADKEPARAPQPITLMVDKAEMRALNRFQEAAVVVTQSQLEHLEHLSRAVFDCVAAIRGYSRQAAKAPSGTARQSSWLAIDPDRCRAGIMVVTTLWIAFLLWVYIDLPGDAGFVMMATIFALIIAYVPQAGTLTLSLSWILGIAFAGVLYVFVMPHLSGFGQLGLMVFGAFFVMNYVLGEPRQTVARLFAMVAFLIIISIDNQQTYSFSDYINTTAMLLLGLGLAVVTNYIPTSPRPEKVFLRLLRRFFRHAELLTSRLGPDEKQQNSMARRWKTVLYRNDLLDVPGKLAACSQQLDYRVLPDNSPEQVRALVTSLYALNDRIKDALEARGHVHADRLYKPVQNELRAWHQVIEERLRRRADDPTQFIEPSTAVRDRLAVRLAGLETVIDEAAASAGEGALGTEDLKQLLRLLGSYRGLSEAAIGYAELAENIDWARWREARF